MKTFLSVGLIVAAALVFGGCVVGQKKYDALVAETEAAKTDLEKTRALKNALEQQVKSLKDSNSKMSADAEFVSAELQRIKDSREKERSSIDGRTKELEQKVKELSAQHRALRQEYEDAKKHNETLKATVARYQKELKERERAVTLPSQPVIPKDPSMTPSPVPPAGASGPRLPGEPAAPRADLAPTPPSPPRNAALNINTASSTDLILFLGLTKEMADRVVANRPYKVKGELVAKNILPKAMFDGLKDRMTVTP